MKQLPLLPDPGPGPTPPARPGARSSAELWVSLLDRGVDLSLAATGPDGIRCLASTRLEVAPPVRVRSAVGGGLLPVPRDGRFNASGEFFQLPLRLAGDALAGHPGGTGRLQAMPGAMARAARHLQRLLVPRAVRAARAFDDPLLWWSVYAVAADDLSGRLAQVAEVCPGLLRFMLATGSRQWHPGCSRVEAPLAGEPLCEEICAAVVAGQRLGRVLDRAARAWMRRNLHRLGRSRGEVPSEEEMEQMIAHQRVRIRSAGPLVPGELLHRPPPPGMVPEDIPRDPARNLGWYELTSQPWLPWSWPPGRLSRTQVAGLSRFLSRQGEALRRCCHPSVFDGPDQLQRFLGHLQHYLEHTGRVLNRRTSPARLLDDMDRWVVGLGESCDLPPDTQLQTLGLTPWRGGDAAFWPIPTVGQLVKETRRMRHCVASMAAAGVMGQAVFVHGEICKEPVTLEVAPTGDGGFRLAEARGERDRFLSDAEGEAVERWLRHVAAGCDQRAGDRDDDIPF